MPLVRHRFPAEPPPYDYVPAPAPPKLGVIQTTTSLMGDYRTAAIWYSIMERSYAEAVEKLKAVVRDDFKLGIAGAAEVQERVPCIIDLSEAQTRRQEQEIRRAHRRAATIFAGFVDRLVRYNAEARVDAYDFLTHEFMVARPLVSQFKCETFRPPVATETEPKKKRKAKSS